MANTVGGQNSIIDLNPLEDTNIKKLELFPLHLLRVFCIPCNHTEVWLSAIPLKECHTIYFIFLLNNKVNY